MGKFGRRGECGEEEVRWVVLEWKMMGKKCGEKGKGKERRRNWVRGIEWWL
jgi:hypothetical protein